MSPSSRVLIVEDDLELAAVLEESLRRAGFDTSTAATAYGAIERARAWRPDVVLLDLLLPDGSGKDVCLALKTDPATRRGGVIITSALGGEIDRVVGFELGADDYVTKPYSVRELVLRLHALLRRRARDLEVEPGLVTAGRLVIDAAAKQAIVDGSAIALSTQELNLLSVLVARPEQVLSRAEITRELWGPTVDPERRAVDTLLKRLRQKLGTARDYLQTLRGVGFRFSLRVGDDAGDEPDQGA